MLQQFRHHGSVSPQNQEYRVWKHDNHPFGLESASEIDQKKITCPPCFDPKRWLAGIHKILFEVGFVNEAHDWCLSSTNPQSLVKV